MTPSVSATNNGVSTESISNCYLLHHTGSMEVPHSWTGIGVDKVAMS